MKIKTALMLNRIVLRSPLFSIDTKLAFHKRIKSFLKRNGFRGV